MHPKESNILDGILPIMYSINRTWEIDVPSKRNSKKNLYKFLAFGLKLSFLS